MNNLEKKFIDYCNSTIWKDDTPIEILNNLSDKVFLKLVEGKTKAKLLYRICGQSGSGKTTQLLHSVNSMLELHKLEPVVVAVRNFAEYHPQYNKLLNDYGKSEIREKTNGFALKLLCLTLCKIIENGYFVVMDITLLSTEFEKLVLDLLNRFDYKREYLVMSVSKTQSDYFIQKRSMEEKRIVYSKSSNFFYDILPISMEFLTKNDSKSFVSIWSAYDKMPIYFGLMQDAYLPFLKYRELNFPLEIDENILRKSKLEFLVNNSKLLKNIF